MLEIYTSIERRKPRLSSRFAWPIGVELLSDRLSKVPQYDQMKVWFSDEPIQDEWGRPTAMNKVADQELPYQILTAKYYVYNRSARWYMMVYPVCKQLRSVANDLILSEGIPHIVAFLSRDFTETEMQVSHHYRCIFDPEGKSLQYQHEMG